MRDPSLGRERTGFAWQRSGLGLGLLAGLLLTAGVRRDTPLGFVAALAVGAAAAVVLTGQ